ncbi:MAG: glycosyltransferase family 4 protein [Lewinellaceae bacterium]|nr:glycosyltransferase family 4 protein [Lewinellaceae bacterium]
MKILLVLNSRIPTQNYDDAERVLWWQGRQLHEMGHTPLLLVKKNSKCAYAPVLVLNEKKPLAPQIPEDTDLVHFFYRPLQKDLAELGKPYLITNFDNSTTADTFDPNTVFLSANHAARHGASVFVHPGLDFRDYGDVLLDFPRNYFHFLGDAAWRGRNVRGAIDLAARVGTRVHVIGGSRVNFRKGLRITLSPSARFHGVLNREGRNMMLNGSRGLLFPIIWQEPFGLPVIESLYFGCPVFGTPFGALPEILCRKTNTDHRKWTGQVDGCFSEFGCLSVKRTELEDAIRHANSFSPERCTEYTKDSFSAERMARDYLRLYEQVLNGNHLHDHAPAMVEAPDNRFLRLES